MTTAPLTRFCFVRHGETDWNRERRLQGQIDTPLNATGLEQAHVLSQALMALERHFDALYCSDLERTRQTAAPIGLATGLEINLDPQLRERHYGHLQGLTYHEAGEILPEAYRRHRNRDPHEVPEGGESLHAFNVRIQAFLDSAVAEHPGQSLLVVTHGGVLDMVYRIATGKPLADPRDFPIPNAAFNWVVHHRGEWQLEMWADRSHLSGSLDELL